MLVRLLVVVDLMQQVDQIVLQLLLVVSRGWLCPRPTCLLEDLCELAVLILVILVLVRLLLCSERRPFWLLQLAPLSLLVHYCCSCSLVASAQTWFDSLVWLMLLYSFLPQPSVLPVCH